MKTQTFTAIYQDYAEADARTFIATLSPVQQSTATVTVVMNEADRDGFNNWTATVTYVA